MRMIVLYCPGCGHPFRQNTDAIDTELAACPRCNRCDITITVRRLADGTKQLELQSIHTLEE